MMQMSSWEFSSYKNFRDLGRKENSFEFSKIRCKCRRFEMMHHYDVLNGSLMKW